MFFFFFSSRRRHTRWTGDWSSDVCSSDLVAAGEHAEGECLGGLGDADAEPVVEAVHVATLVGERRLTTCPTDADEPTQQVGDVAALAVTPVTAPLRWEYLG